MNSTEQPINGKTHLLVGLVLLCFITSNVHAVHSTDVEISNNIEFNLPDGAQFDDVVNLTGVSTIPLKNASWSIVNISGVTPTTLLSGPYLTSVQPVAEDLFSWSLIVDVSDVDCTCYVELNVDEERGKDGHGWKPQGHDIARLVVYLGENHHRPVFPHEINHMSESMPESLAEASEHATLLSSEFNISYPIVTAPNSGSIVSVHAMVCPAPYGVCTTTPLEVDIPFTVSDHELLLAVDPALIQLEEGIWQFDFTAKDALLRTTHSTRAIFLHDTQAPLISLTLDSIVNESEPVHVYASLDDGYVGAKYSMTWSLEYENEQRRAPLSHEVVSEDHLLLNLTEQGAYTIHLSVRDLAGHLETASADFTVLNLRPTARITIEGMVLSDNGRFSVDLQEEWELNASESFDNEVVDYLWVINDDRSVRGTPTLDSTQLSEVGLHQVELIVFDDDGATHSTVVEIEILGKESTESQRGPLLALLALVAIAALVLVLRIKEPSSPDLPKWNTSESLGERGTGSTSPRSDATVEEDEPRG
ncbi:MAG: hypothetical protein QF880_02635 [Candidatus Poseidonia sp.]|nr:hypothetical protein [Poseidonia sp.]